MAREFPADEVEAVLGAREPDALEDPQEAWRAVRALHRVRHRGPRGLRRAGGGLQARQEHPRAGQSGPGRRPRPDAFERSDAERELHGAVAPAAGGDGGYEERLRSLASLRAPVDRFFDDVLVMAEDAGVRANRLGLLSATLSLFYRIADISKLGG